MKAISQKISIPNILEVGKEKLSECGKLIAKNGFRKVVLFFGGGIYDLFGKTFIQALTSSSIQILKQYEGDDNEVCRITSMAFSLPADTELVIGIGGGKVLDIAKYVAFLNHYPYVSFPTSTSHDGFASSGCSLIVDGRRTSVPAKMPYGIIVDIDIIKSSPEKFIYSGIGDLVSKISAIFDWQYEENNGKTIMNDFAVMIAKKSVNSIVRMDFTGLKDDFFLKELIDSLTMSGISMEIAGNSAPASGSEHLISHALDKLTDKPQLHGIQVGIATYIMSKVQNHRSQRIEKFLTQTGFFQHVAQLGMRKSDYEKAIELAPSIKPYRYTFIHQDEYRNAAKKLLSEDRILNEVLQ